VINGNFHAEKKVPTIQRMLDEVYNLMKGSEASREYSERHNINSAAILTVIDDDSAAAIVDLLEDRIAGRVVVEIGAGIGLLGLHMGHVAKRVYCIEANPMWSWTFANLLLEQKPKNVSYLFGAADEFLGTVRGDVAVFCTHSDVKGMGLVAAQFAPTVIDVYGELIREHPESFDPFASKLRNFI